MNVYKILDVSFFVFHSCLIFFITCGWAWRKTRKIHLGLVVCTVASWFGLGLVYGIGFCPCTEWHWQIREGLGDRDLPNSYIKFLLDSLTGLDWNATLVDGATFAVFAIVAVLSVVLNCRDRRKAAR